MSDSLYFFSESYTYKPGTTVATTNAGGGEANLLDYDMATYWTGNDPSGGPCEIVWTFTDTQTIDAIWFKGYNIGTYKVYAWIAAAWHLVDTVVVTDPLTSYNLHIFDHTHQSSSWKLAITLTASPGVPLVYEGMLMKYLKTLSDTDDSLPSNFIVTPVDRIGGSYILADGSATSYRGIKVYHDITYEFEYTSQANRDALYSLFYSTTYGIRPNLIIYPDIDEPEDIFRVVFESIDFPFSYTIPFKGSGWSGSIKFKEY